MIISRSGTVIGQNNRAFFDCFIASVTVSMLYNAGNRSLLKTGGEVDFQQRSNAGQASSFGLWFEK